MKWTPLVRTDLRHIKGKLKDSTKLVQNRRCTSLLEYNGLKKSRVHNLILLWTRDMVRMTGLEPARQRQRNLNPPSLPIPPHPRRGYFITDGRGCQCDLPRAVRSVTKISHIPLVFSGLLLDNPFAQRYNIFGMVYFGRIGVCPR